MTAPHVRSLNLNDLMRAVKKQERYREQQAQARIRVRIGTGLLLGGLLQQQRLKTENTKRWDVISMVLLTYVVLAGWVRALSSPPVDRT